MDWYLVLGLAFLLVAAAEIGDKTQLMTISLASKYHHHPVFWGVFLGMGVITVMGVMIGTVLYKVIPIFYVKILAGFIFIIFGIYSFYKEEKEREEEIPRESVFKRSFGLSLVAELGDKTQLAVIALTARYQAPGQILIGSLAGLALVIGLGVLLGSKIADVVEKDKIDLASSILFVVLGIAFILETVLF